MNEDNYIYIVYLESDMSYDDIVSRISPILDTSYDEHSYVPPILYFYVYYTLEHALKHTALMHIPRRLVCVDNKYCYKYSLYKYDLRTLTDMVIKKGGIICGIYLSERCENI